MPGAKGAGTCMLLGGVLCQGGVGTTVILVGDVESTPLNALATALLCIAK